MRHASSLTLLAPREARLADISAWFTSSSSRTSAPDQSERTSSASTEKGGWVDYQVDCNW